MRRPREEMDKAFSHASDSGEATLSNWDLEMLSAQWLKRVSNKCWTVGRSQNFCWFVALGRGVSSGKALLHLTRA